MPKNRWKENTTRYEATKKRHKTKRPRKMTMVWIKITTKETKNNIKDKPTTNRCRMIAAALVFLILYLYVVMVFLFSFVDYCIFVVGFHCFGSLCVILCLFSFSSILSLALNVCFLVFVEPHLFFLVIQLLYMVVFWVWVSLCVFFGLLVVFVSVFVLVPCLVVFLRYLASFCSSFFFCSCSYVGEMWARHTPRGSSQKPCMMIGWKLQQDAEVKHIKNYCSSRSADNVDV